jgi:hypothetical protein
MQRESQHARSVSLHYTPHGSSLVTAHYNTMDHSFTQMLTPYLLPSARSPGRVSTHNGLFPIIGRHLAYELRLYLYVFWKQPWHHTKSFVVERGNCHVQWRIGALPAKFCKRLRSARLALVAPLASLCDTLVLGCHRATTQIDTYVYTDTTL